MLKFDIVGDYNFDAPYLLYLKSILTKIVGLDSNSNLIFVVNISTQFKML